VDGGAAEASPAIVERRELRKKQEESIRGALEFNEKALTEFDRVSAALSEIRTSKGLSDMGLEASMAELLELANRAKKYSINDQGERVSHE
jgi:hypothetical protein